MSTFASHLRDSAAFGDLWCTPEVREWFSEETRTRTWLDILGRIALAQSDLGEIPASAATRIAQVCASAQPPLDEIAAATRDSGHSSYGLLEWLQRVVGPQADGYVAMATTVQDITDLWTAYTIRFVSNTISDDLDQTVTVLRREAARYRSAPMLARTHGQPAVPMTLGWKLAAWGIELERHQQRLAEGRNRWEVAAVGGSVGTLAYWRSDAPRMMAAVAERTGLGLPVAPWGAARDNIAEFAAICALLTATLAKIGNEIYQLQRPEIGEVAEAATPAQVGSVTMPHKRNPERSEHLTTLSSLTRVSSAALMEAVAGEHERDGRTWKVEWIALPDLCCYAAAAANTASQLLTTVSFDTTQMQRNVEACADLVLSEQRMRSLQAVRRYRDAYRRERITVGTTHGDQTSRRGPTMKEAILSAEALVDRWLATGSPVGHPLDPAANPAPDSARALVGGLTTDSAEPLREGFRTSPSPTAADRSRQEGR